MAAPSHLIVGLGNPGSEYRATRHNIGFMAADFIAEHYKCPEWQRKFQGYATGPRTGAHFLLLKPQTYMNLSGEAVGAALRFFKLEPHNVIVFHDDLDLLPGQVKIKQGGGSGGHNGLKSIDAHIGQDYWRVRLGIGHPGVKGDAVTHYVLGGFAKSDLSWLEPLLTNVAKKLTSLLEGRHKEFLAEIAPFTDRL